VDETLIYALPCGSAVVNHLHAAVIVARVSAGSRLLGLAALRPQK
jgi:hypothetical protein